MELRLLYLAINLYSSGKGVTLVPCLHFSDKSISGFVKYLLGRFNSSRPSVAYMRQKTTPPLLQLKARHLFSVTPLTEKNA